MFGVAKVNKKDKHFACLFCSNLDTLGDFEKSHHIRRHSKKLQMQGARMPAFNKQVEE
jgi:hypothetical protein